MPIRQQRIGTSPVRFAALLLVIIFVAEVGVMLGLRVLVSPQASRLTGAGVDALLLVLILAPILWWMLIRPLQGSVASEQQRAARLVAILEATPDLVGIADAEGRMSYLNHAGRKMLGVDEPTDLSKYNLREFYDAANGRVVVTEAIPTAIRDGAWSGETELVALDGHALTTSQVILAHKAPDGTVMFLSTIARDVTDRNRAQEALAESEGRYAALFANMVEGFAYCQMLFESNRPQDFIYLAVNTAFETLTGLQNVVGRRVTEIFPGIREADPELFEIYGRVVQTGHPERFEHYFKPLDVWLDISVYRPREGCFVAVFDNITERKRLEGDLRATEARYRIAAESVSDVIVTIDQDSRIILFANSAVESMFGYSPSELLGKELTMLMPESYRDAHRTGVKRYVETGIRHLNWKSTLVTGLPKSGKEIRVEASYGEYVDGPKRYFVGVLRDVTEAMLAAESLKLFRALIDRSNDIIEVVDPGTGRLLDINATGCVDLGYTREEMLTLSVFDLDPTLNQSSFQRFAEELRKSGVLLVEGVHRRKNGSRYPVEVNISQVQLDRAYAVAVVRDISERKQAEERLRNNEAELREAQRIAGIGSWEWMPATNTIIWSEGLNRILGRDLDCPAPAFEILGKFYTKESWERLQAAIAGALERGTPYDLELQMVRDDGRTCWTTTRGEAFRGPDGAVVMLRGTVHDIEKRHEADAKLRLQSAALNAAADAMIITGRSGTIEWINAAFTDLYGYNEEEALGKNPRELVKSGVHDQAIYKDLWDTILAGRVWKGELMNRRKDGSLCSGAVTITPVKDASGEPAHFISINRDLTEEKRLQAQFRQAQKMEGVGQLAGGIAHDFNNLLTIINGTAELALVQLQEGHPLQEDLQEIRRAGERAAALTRQLLAFSRKQILRPEVLNLGTVVAGMESLLRRLLGEDIDLVVVPTQGLRSVKADVGQMEQVIVNLAVNARDAMPQGGKLTIETQNVEIDEQYTRQHQVVLKPGPHVMLAMSDTGVGMDEVTRGRIFEPFFTTKGPGKGTGLGLSTVYGIVKQSNGLVWVYSEVGKGSCFKVYLPQAAEVGEVSRSRRTVAPAHGTETILIVEDVGGLSKLARRMLESAGYSVLTAASADEAVLVMERHEGRVHLMLTDVVMPGMSGRTLAERIDRTLPGMKVLYMSGYTDDVVVRHGVLDEGMPFLSKPFTAAELIRKVREVLDSKS